MREPDHKLQSSKNEIDFATTESMHPNADLISDGKMHIEFLDFLKFYGGNSRGVSIAVRVVDSYSHPIDNAEVGVRIVLSNGGHVTYTKLTDKDGVSTFELEDIPSCQVGVGISKVEHPMYQLDNRNYNDRWRITNV